MYVPADLDDEIRVLYAHVAEAWALDETDPTIDQRASLRLAATHAVGAAARVVDRAYDAGGGTSILEDSELQRSFRDDHAIAQHMIVGQPTLELVGRVLVGVETDVSQL